jgi:hypothetical protein
MKRSLYLLHWFWVSSNTTDSSKTPHLHFHPSYNTRVVTVSEAESHGQCKVDPPAGLGSPRLAMDMATAVSEGCILESNM